MDEPARSGSRTSSRSTCDGCRMASDILPAVAHPYLTQGEVRAFCAKHQIAVEAWSPIARAGYSTIPRSRRSRPGRGRALLRWSRASTSSAATSTPPKSVTPARIKENIDIFDFRLTDQDLAAITALNRDERTGPDPDTFDILFD